MGSLAGSDTTKTVFIKKLSIDDMSGDNAGEGSPRSSAETRASLKLDFLKEAFVLCQLQHENVVSLVGIITETTQVAIAMEYAENGTLDVLLRANEGVFDLHQLQTFMRQIASGMNYLSRNGYVHRCLAASNVLVNAKFDCKISKFKTATKERVKVILIDCCD